MNGTRMAARVYGLALRAFPSMHRAAYGAEMIDTFQCELTAQRRAHGRRRALRFTLTACLDAISSGLGERRRRRAGGVFNRLISQCRVCWPDIKLSARLLFKYPGLTLVASLGITVAVTIAAAFFSFTAAIDPALPLEEGHRVVAVENWDVAGNNEDRRSLHDFVAWRQEVKSIADIGAFHDVQTGLAIAGGEPAAIEIAAMSASGFRVARVAPLLGRYLVDDDERDGAPPVLVIGHEAWRSRFAQDRSVVGQQVRVGQTVHTIVGVMPERFGFPVDHQYWIPFRPDPLAVPRGTGPELFVFGRLAPGAAIETAQAELSIIGRRTAAAFPATHAQLKPQVLQYTRPLLDVQEGNLEWGLLGMRVVMSLLLIAVAFNVAILVYARTALRRGEIAVRTALGASRGRIVTQLFAEALVLAIGPALVGLWLSQAAWQFGNELMELDLGMDVPFWTDYSLRPSTALYTGAMVVLAAAIIGVLPALQATRRRNAPGIRPGRMWTTLVVAQVALAVALLPAAVKNGLNEIRTSLTQPAFDPDRFVWARITTDRNEFGDSLGEVMRRLEAEADVAGATFSSGVRGRSGRLPLEVEGLTAPAQSNHETVSVGVDRRYFDVYGARVGAGRGLEAQDSDAASRAIVVNRSFVRKVLGGENALGRRVRFTSGPWYEIVGVVDNLRTNPIDADDIPANVFFAVAPRHQRAAGVAVRLRADASPLFGERLRDIAAGVDPALRLDDLRIGMPSVLEDQLAVRLVGVALSVVVLTVFVFSAAGVYALMSFTVAQRRREIGIRAALGASPRRLLMVISSRVAWQLGAGLAAGMAIGVAIDVATGGAAEGGLRAIVLPAIALTMAIVGGLAAIGPARRGLATQPTDALRTE